MLNTNNRDEALKNLKNISDDIHTNLMERSDRLTDINLWCMIAFAPIVYFGNDDGNLIKQSLDYLHQKTGNWGLFAIAEGSLAAMFTAYARSTISDFWDKKNRDFVWDEKHEIRFNDDRKAPYPLYTIEDISAHVRHNIEEETGTKRFPAIKKLFQERNGMFGWEPHALMTCFFATQAIAMGVIMLTAEPKYEEPRAQSFKIETPSLN